MRDVHAPLPPASVAPEDVEPAQGLAGALPAALKVDTGAGMVLGGGRVVMGAMGSAV